ncbi:MAG: DUF389 domain-containing protein [Rubripirellula sp.]
MSLVFVVGSEEQINGGTGWYAQLADVHPNTLRVVVLGSERKALAEYARRKISEFLDCHAESFKVALVDQDTDAVLAYAKSVDCDRMLLIHEANNADTQRDLFQSSMYPTLWLRVAGSPPESAVQVHAAFRRPSQVTTLAAEKFFRSPPENTLCEEADLDRDDLVEAVKTSMGEEGIPNRDLILCGIDDPDSSDRIYKAGLLLIESKSEITIGLLHDGFSMAEKVANQVYSWATSVAPPMDRQQRIELAQDLQLGSQPNLEFLGLISAAAMLAAFGLVQNSAAVIIGAMLIAPLMTPIIGAGLALAQGNRPLFRSAIWTILLGFFGALVSSMVFGWLVILFQDPIVTDEMWARCRPSPIDFCVGLVGGLAASYARTRNHLSSALAGAAIAAALVPPISTAGLQLAFRVWTWDEPTKGAPILGPLLLVAVNVLMIMVGSSFVLWARGMRTERTLTFKDRWTVRMFALLIAIALLIMIWLLHPFTAA